MGFRQAVVLLAFVALIARVVVYLATPNFHPIDDSHSYDRMAVSLADHGTLPRSLVAPAGGAMAYPPPFYPVVLSLAYRIVGTSSAHARWDAGRIEEAVLGTIVVVLIALIVARVFGRTAAIVAGAIAAVYPPLMLIGSSLMSESVFIPLELGAVLCALVHRDSPLRWRWLMASGVLAGLAALTRSSGAVLVLPLCFLVWTERPRWSWRAGRAPLALIGAACVTIAPWTIRNAIDYHELVPISTETGFALAGTYNAVAEYDKQYPALWVPPAAEYYAYIEAHPRANEAQISDDLVTFSRRYIVAHPLYPFAVVLWGGLRLFNLTGTGLERYGAQFEGYSARFAVISVYAFWVVGALALLGLAIGRPRRAPLALWGVPLILILSNLPFGAGLTRYRSPSDPFFIMLAALALLAAAARLRGQRVASPAA